MMRLTGHWLVWVALYGVVWGSNLSDLRKLVQTIHSYGYVVEIHTVTTTDGYILRMFRIPHGKNNANVQDKPVVHLQHGVCCSGAYFFAAYERSPAYILADAGFDVWILNARGSSFSREHQTLNADLDPQYWNFSWHEVGIFDLPSTIDYVLDTTKQEKLFFIGHSEGTTTYYVLLSEKPEYNKKISLHISLAPIAYLTHISGISGLLKPILIPILQLFQNLGIHEIKRSVITPFIPLCNKYPILCGTVVYAFVGFDYMEMNKTITGTFLDYYPGGCSTKQLQHFAQSMKQGYFRQYDYGEKENLERYGWFTPPVYNLDNIEAPITFIYGNTDYLAVVPDVKRLMADVTNSVAKTEVRAPYERWNHLDYLISNKVDEVTDFIISQLNGYLQ